MEPQIEALAQAIEGFLLQLPQDPGSHNQGEHLPAYIRDLVESAVKIAFGMFGYPRNLMVLIPPVSPTDEEIMVSPGVADLSGDLFPHKERRTLMPAQTVRFEDAHLPIVGMSRQEHVRRLKENLGLAPDAVALL
jgi:hypothetical protein